MRVGVIGLVFAALLGSLGLRLWTMQVVGAEAYTARAERQQVRVVKAPAPRGDIFDVNGVKLAGTRSALAAVVDLALVDVDDAKRLAENLGAFLNESASDILEEFSAENRSRDKQITVAEDLTDAQVVFLVEHREDFPGVTVIPQPIRTYPLGEVAAHVLGYIGRPNDEDLEREDVDRTDFVGRAGVERSYDAQLQGSEGVLQYQVDANRKVLSLVGEQPPVAGRSLILTIDSLVQEQLQDSLRLGLIQARQLEMDERVEAVEEQSRSSRLSEALFEARADAADAKLAEEESTTSTTEAGSDEDDGVASAPTRITVDPGEVLASLYTGLPIDSDGVCVPVQRVATELESTSLLSGLGPRIVQFESVKDVGGELVATVVVAGEAYVVERNTSFASTLSVLHVSETEIVLMHRDKWCPVRATGVVLDPNDGSIIAMSSFPTYDPTVFVGGLSADQWASLSTVSAFQNFAVQGLYAPASTFKVVPYVLALEESLYPIDRGIGDKEVGESEEDAPEPVPLLTDTDKYSCSGEFKFALNDGTVQTKRDWKWPGGHGPLDLHGALEASCDLYFWDLALRLWQERRDDSGLDKENLIQEYARSFGFGTASGVDLPFEKDGLIPDRTWFLEEQQKETGRVREGSWVGGDLMDIAVGQGAVLTTPLQLANGFAAMVNGGTVWQPRVVKEIVDGDGNVIEENAPQIVSTVNMDARTVRLLRQDLQQVVNNQERGTARVAFRGFGDNVELVGGKTGTGEVLKAPRSEHFRQVDDALFVGIAPINSPKWVVAIIIERGGSGGRIAAPVARQVLQYLLNGPEAVTELVPGIEAD